MEKHTEPSANYHGLDTWSLNEVFLRKFNICSLNIFNIDKPDTCSERCS